MNVLVPLALVLLPLAWVLKEAVPWFGRNALDEDIAETEENGGAQIRSAFQVFLLGRFLTWIAFALLGWVSVVSGSLVALAGVAVGGLVWSLVGSVLGGLRWQSPLSLAGRAVYRPLAPLGVVLRWLLFVWGRARASTESAGRRLKEQERETDWLLGRTGEERRGKMLATLQEFGQSLVEDVMVPREEVAGVPAGAKVPEILSILGRERHSRYPVYRDSLDSVTGVLHVFDLLTAPSGADAAGLARKPFFTNETKPVRTLLRELQLSYNQMAVVVDEYGGTAGIVTVEDLLEELVGEIEDEDDVEEAPLRSLGPGVFWVDGTMRIEDLNEALELELEEGEYDTLAGLVLERLERIPRAGERIEENGLVLEVLSAGPQRILSLRLLLGSGVTRRASRKTRE